MTENTSDIEPQERPTRADTYERRIRGTFGTLGFILVLFLFPDPSMGSDSDNLPVKWWIVTGVAAVVTAESWLLARSRMPRWLARHLTGGEQEVEEPVEARLPTVLPSQDLDRR
jgi:hypothetical protein